MKCCNTGQIYDPGTFQCCVVSGLQSVNAQCPCFDSTHCGLNQTCCQQQFPLPIEITTTPTGTPLCSPYVNFPSGGTSVLPASNQVQPCLGQCIDLRFQICCNGVACINGLERCCNSTCCNRYNQHCAIGALRSGTANSRNNYNEFRAEYYTCTTIEALTPDRATMAFLHPIVMLVAIFVSFATSFFFARRANAMIPLTAYQKGMFAIASICVVFSLPLIFAGSLYKYALVIMWICFFTIIVALTQIRGLYITAAVFHVVLLIYLIDPFYGNELLTLAHTRAVPGASFNVSGVGFNGILHSINSIWRNPDNTSMPLGLRCTNFYLGWFTRDPNVEDRQRFDNPDKPTFGYCSRDYGMILYIFSGLTIILVYFLFFLTLITHMRSILIGKADRLGGTTIDFDVPAGEYEE